MGLLMSSCSLKKGIGFGVRPYDSDRDEKFPGTNSNEDLGGNKMSRKSTFVRVSVDDGTGPQKQQANRTHCCDTSRYIILTAVIAIVLVAFAVILALYVRGLQDSDLIARATEPCYEEECISRAADLLSSMNRSVDPCEDFYSFSCGGWERKTLMPTTNDQINVLGSLSDSNREFIKKVFGDPETIKKYSKNRAVMKSIDFYKTCLSKNINKQEDTQLKEIIKSLGGSNLTTVEWNSTDYDLNKAMLTTFGQLGVQPFFSLDVFADFLNSSIRRFGISEGGIVLAHTFYVEKNSTEIFYSKTRNAYREYMVDVMRLFGADEQETKRQMAQVYLFEEKIAEAIKKNKNGMPSMTTIKSLSNYTNFDWLGFLGGLTANQIYKLTGNENVLVKTIDLLKDIAAVINETDKATLSNYIAWTVIEKVIQHLPDKYGDARLAYDTKINGDAFTEEERWITCYEATKEAFPMAIGLIFVDKKLSPQARERAAEIFEEIKREFLRKLKSQTWMDEETRRNAKQKAEAMTLLGGYPDYIKDEEKLNKKYEKVQVKKEKYLQTIFNIRKIAFQEKIDNLKRPIDKTTFDMSPIDVNAYHYYQQNKIVFLAGVLQSPFYDVNRLRASNYGGIGVIAGHELTHGFDHSGRSYNKYGNLANWWTKHSLNEYTKKSECLTDQYSQFELYGKKVNGKLTLGENIADNGGVKFAFEAYKRWVEEHGEEYKLPGIDYTPYQLFFIAYAQGWCSKYTRQGALDQLDNKPWPTMNIRVQGAVMNSLGFAKAFNCKPGTRMNPVKKCSVW